MNTPKLILPILQRKLRTRYYKTDVDDLTPLLKVVRRPWWARALRRLVKKIKYASNPQNKN